jgi:hypothetical protein
MGKGALWTTPDFFIGNKITEGETLIIATKNNKEGSTYPLNFKTDLICNIMLKAKAFLPR